MMVRSGKVALIAGITGQDGAYLARFLLEKGYVVHGTSRDAALARLDGLIALGISDQITLHSMSPVDFQSVAQVIEDVAPDEIYRWMRLSHAFNAHAPLLTRRYKTPNISVLMGLTFYAWLT